MRSEKPANEWKPMPTPAMTNEKRYLRRKLIRSRVNTKRTSKKTVEAKIQLRPTIESPICRRLVASKKAVASAAIRDLNKASATMYERYTESVPSATLMRRAARKNGDKSETR